MISSYLVDVLYRKYLQDAESLGVCTLESC